MKNPEAVSIRVRWDYRGACFFLTSLLSRLFYSVLQNQGGNGNVYHLAQFGICRIRCGNCGHMNNANVADFSEEFDYEETSENRMGSKCNLPAKIEISCKNCKKGIGVEVIATEYPQGCLEDISANPNNVIVNPKDLSTLVDVSMD